MHLRETHLPRTRSRTDDRARIALCSDNLARRAHHTRSNNGHTPSTRATAQDALAPAQARTAEEPFGVRSKPSRLTNETFVLGRITSERVLVRFGHWRHRR